MVPGPGSSEDGSFTSSRIATFSHIARRHHFPHFSSFSSASARLLATLLFAAALAIAPNPVFAQHGGGGGGHAGGGFGGGGGHFGGGGGGHFGGGGPAGGSRGGSSSGNTSGGAAGNSGSHAGAPGTNATGNSAHGSNGASGGAAGSNTANSAAAHSTASSRFVSGSVWQAPPSAAMRSGAQPSPSHFMSTDEAAASGTRIAAPPVEPHGMRGPLAASTTLRSTPRSATGATFAHARPSPLHIGPFPPRRVQPVFFFGGCGFFPGFCGYGFLPYWCDPWLAQWGCGAGYGYGGFALGGYYGGGGYGNVIYGDSTDESSVSNEFNPSRYSFPQAGPEPSSGGSSSSSDSEVVLFLKDGTVYAITDYWVADGKLHYVTNYGGENSIDLDTIDMQRTVDVNARRGVSITLRPAPAPPSTPDAPPVPEAAPAPPSAPPAPPAPQSAPAPNPPPPPDSAPPPQ